MLVEGVGEVGGGGGGGSEGGGNNLDCLKVETKEPLTKLFFCVSSTYFLLWLCVGSISEECATSQQKQKQNKKTLLYHLLGTNPIC